MCAQYLITKNLESLKDLLGIRIDTIDIAYPLRVLPHRLAPVIIKSGIKTMNFSLIPSWSQERRPKFATHNARVETITEKATWKKPFMTSHCVVPFNSFVEPIYVGELAGNMVGFDSDDFLYAAGITDSWLDQKTGEVVESFSIITSEPNEFVKKAGHDRQPIFIRKNDIQNWLNLTGKNPNLIVQELIAMAYNPELKTSIDRPLKPGWKKRIE